jgi:hypothetical protein
MTLRFIKSIFPVIFMKNQMVFDRRKVVAILKFRLNGNDEHHQNLVIGPMMKCLILFNTWLTQNAD